MTKSASLQDLSHGLRAQLWWIALISQPNKWALPEKGGEKWHCAISTGERRAKLDKEQVMWNALFLISPHLYLLMVLVRMSHNDKLNLGDAAEQLLVRVFATTWLSWFIFWVFLSREFSTEAPKRTKINQCVLNWPIPISPHYTY